MATYICPSCEHVQRSYSPYCPQCGKPLGAPPPRIVPPLPDDVVSLGPAAAAMPWLGGLTKIIVVIAVAALVIRSLPALGQQLTALGESIGPSCTMGVPGTNAQITFQGWQARQACSGSLSSVVAVGAESGNPVVCQGDYRGQLAWRVRDTGYHIVGTVLCADAEQRLR